MENIRQRTSVNTPASVAYSKTILLYIKYIGYIFHS